MTLEDSPRGWHTSTVGLVTLVIALVLSTVGLGYVSFNDAASVKSQSTEISNLQNQVSQLNSFVASLKVQNAALQSQNSALNATVAAYASAFPQAIDRLNCMAGSGFAFQITNLGSASFAVPASGIQILGPNGSKVLPILGSKFGMAVYNSGECIGVNAPLPLSSAVVPAGKTVWFEITDDSLTGLGPSGNYIMTFSNTSLATHGTAAVPPIWIPWTSSNSVTLLYTMFKLGDSQGFVFINNNSNVPIYITGASLSYAGGGCSISFPPKPMYQGEGWAIQWSYTGGNPCPNLMAKNGAAYTGLVNLSDGRQIPFSGTFG